MRAQEKIHDACNSVERGDLEVSVVVPQTYPLGVADYARNSQRECVLHRLPLYRQQSRSHVSSRVRLVRIQAGCRLGSLIIPD